MKAVLVKGEQTNRQFRMTELEHGKRYVLLSGNVNPISGNDVLKPGDEVLSATSGMSGNYVVSIKTGIIYMPANATLFGTPERHKEKAPDVVQIECTPLEAMQLAAGAYYQGSNSQETTGDTLLTLLKEAGHNAFEAELDE